MIQDGFDKSGSRDISDSENYAELRDRVMEMIHEERERQISLNHGGDTEEFDRGNTRNDWIAYVTAYIGRAAEKCFRNEKENQDFVVNMTKAAALCVAAIESHYKGYC